MKQIDHALEADTSTDATANLVKGFRHHVMWLQATARGSAELEQLTAELMKITCLLGGVAARVGMGREFLAVRRFVEDPEGNTEQQWIDALAIVDLVAAESLAHLPLADAYPAPSSEPRAIHEALKCPVEIPIKADGSDGYLAEINGESVRPLLTQKQRDLVARLIAAWPHGAGKGELESAGIGDPHKVIDRLYEANARWSIIKKPGRKGRGYLIAAH